MCLSGGPFPLGTLDHLRGLLESLYHKLEALPEVAQKQELDRISDVVVRSALELCDQDMAEAEAGFQLEELAIQTAGGVILEQPRKVEDALSDLYSVVEAAQRDGIRFVLERDDDSA